MTIGEIVNEMEDDQHLYLGSTSRNKPGYFFAGTVEEFKQREPIINKKIMLCKNTFADDMTGFTCLSNLEVVEEFLKRYEHYGATACLVSETIPLPTYWTEEEYKRKRKGN